MIKLKDVANSGSSCVSSHANVLAHSETAQWGCSTLAPAGSAVARTSMSCRCGRHDASLALPTCWLADVDHVACGSVRRHIGEASHASAYDEQAQQGVAICWFSSARSTTADGFTTGANMLWHLQFNKMLDVEMAHLTHVNAIQDLGLKLLAAEAIWPHLKECDVIV